MILLDTNVISEQLRLEPSQVVLGWLNKQALETLYLSSMTVAELRAGVQLMPVGKRQAALHNSIENKLLPLFAGRVLPFDNACSRSYAKVLKTVKATGSGIATADAIIASIAKEGSFIVATRDVSPFVAAGLEVINPWEAT